MIDFRAMTVTDLEAARTLWGKAEGVIMRGADALPALTRYLERNPELSTVAYDDGALIGAVLVGHDGRRGFLHHLAVASTHRRRGIGTELVNRCVAALRREEITKCHLMVAANNADGLAFWKRNEWLERHDLVLMSRALTSESNP